MADKVLSIEVGYSITKVCEIERGSKAPKILNSFVLDTPEGMLRDGVIEQNDSFVNSFRNEGYIYDRQQQNGDERCRYSLC